MMKIKRWQFYSISLLFLLLPFSVQWRILVFGKQTTGCVSRIEQQVIGTHSIESYSIIEFYSSGETFEITGPENVVYQIGKRLRVFYMPENPEKHLLFTFSGLFFNTKSILPFVLFIIWIAFYTSFLQEKNTSKSNINHGFKRRKSIKH